MVTIRLQIQHCGECPKHESKRTVGAGFAHDYICTLTGDKVMGYIEYPSEYRTVPDNCPLRANNIDKMREAINDGRERKDAATGDG
jgi:hypothetical protein